jgi:hypothetical protein
VTIDGCKMAQAAMATPAGELIVLAICDWGLGLFGYDLSP